MGEKSAYELTDAEWTVMECLWEKGSLTAGEAEALLGGRTGWKRSTTLTLLRRLEAKGAVRYSGEGRKHIYTPLIERDEAAVRETEDLISRLYRGSLSLMVSTLTRRQALSEKEKRELYAILRGGPEEEK